MNSREIRFVTQAIDNIARQLQELKNLLVPESSHERASKIKEEAVNHGFTTDEEDKALAREYGLDLSDEERARETQAIQAAWANLEKVNEQEHAALDAKFGYGPDLAAQSVAPTQSLEDSEAGPEMLFAPPPSPGLPQMQMDPAIMEALASRLIPRQSSGMLQVQSLEDWAPEGMPVPNDPRPHRIQSNAEAMNLLNNDANGFFGG